MGRFPQSIAIAGAWGYIGGKFLEAARALRLRTFVYDPGTPPHDLDLRGVMRFTNEDHFYRNPADLFHLAVHPAQRKTGMAILLERAANYPTAILCEKPMAPPEQPEECLRIVEAVNRSGAVVLYDFPELFDPLTRRIFDFLSGFKTVEITQMVVQRSKNRESRSNPRNLKRMVHIQYQESVHCLAFVLNLLATLKKSIEAVFAGGLWIESSSEPYRAPNPKEYPYVVDGKCDYILSLGGTMVTGITNFKKGAEAIKRRTIVGVGDGKEFVIDANYQEDSKHLLITGVRQDYDPATNSYEKVIETLGEWYENVGAQALMSGVYPNPSFARLTYQLSSVLWRSCWDKQRITLASLDELKTFDARFAAEIPNMPRY